MKIELTLEQYTKLAELVCLGNWMANAHRSPDALRDEYDEAEQLFLALSQGAEGNTGIEHNQEHEAYSPGPEMQERLSELVNEYDAATLWEGLAYGLGDRDTMLKEGEPTVEEILGNRQRYLEEFTEHGLDRVKVDWEGK